VLAGSVQLPQSSDSVVCLNVHTFGWMSDVGAAVSPECLFATGLTPRDLLWDRTVTVYAEPSKGGGWS